MKKRPDHATDCPGCSTGWTTGELLCPLCAKAVQTAQPTFYDRWLNARYAAEHDEAMVPMEAYRRGLIIGTAKVLSAQRDAQHAAWRAKRITRTHRTFDYRITPKGEAALEAKREAAIKAYAAAHPGPDPDGILNHLPDDFAAAILNASGQPPQTTVNNRQPSQTPQP